MRLVSSSSAHSTWSRFKSSLSASRAQIGHCYWHLCSFSRYSSLSPSTLRDPLSLYYAALLVFIFTHSVRLIKLCFSSSVLFHLLSLASAEMMQKERRSGDYLWTEAVRLFMNRSFFSFCFCFRKLWHRNIQFLFEHVGILLFIALKSFVLFLMQNILYYELGWTKWQRGGWYDKIS